MSAIDGLLELLSRFEPHGSLNIGRPARRNPGARGAGERGPVAERRRITYTAVNYAGTAVTLSPFSGKLHPVRCGAVQSQTRSARLDCETTADVAAALSFATSRCSSVPMLPELIGWLMRAAAVDLGNSRNGRKSTALVDVGEERGEWKRLVVALPSSLDRVPSPPRAIVVDLAAEILAEARFRGWMKRSDERDEAWWRSYADRIAEAALFATVNVSCCRRCQGAMTETRTVNGEKVVKPCGACAGIGWVSIDRRNVAKALGVSQREHAKRTEPAYRWAFAVTVGRLQEIAHYAWRALRG